MPISLTNRTILIVGLAIVGVLVSLHLSFYIWHFEVDEIGWPVLSMFDLDVEQSFGTWFSTFLLFAVAIVVYSCGRLASAGRWRRHWYVLAAGLAVMSIDEVAGMHETVNTYTEESWALPGLVLVGVLGLAFAPFVLALPARVRFLVVIAGLVYVGGAIGVELATEPFADRGELDTLAYNLTTALEEGMEMASVVVCLYAFLEHLTAGAGSLIGVRLGGAE